MKDIALAPSRSPKRRGARWLREIYNQTKRYFDNRYAEKYRLYGLLMSGDLQCSGNHWGPASRVKLWCRGLGSMVSPKDIAAAIAEERVRLLVGRKSRCVASDELNLQRV
jgi:hypothetical protein